MLTTEEFYLLTDLVGLLVFVWLLLLEDVPVTQQTQEQRIHAMLDNAQDDHEFDDILTTWSVEDIVTDLQAYAELEEEDTVEALTRHVITWKQKRIKPT